MASEEARIPENVPEAWKAIDIYLFSNGQEHTPPRKYHLRVDDLSWWTSTLKYLARSQYGSKHSLIDLYTLEGNKVGSPLELSNGASYVAVYPPNEFIDTGYEKYLIKASRSWEKRQAKKHNSIDVTQDESTEVNALNIDPLNIITDDPKTTIQQESLLHTIVASVVDHQSSSLVTPHPISTPTRRTEVLNNQPVKPSDKKRPNNQRPTFVRKISQSMPQTLPLTSSMKPSFKKKENVKSTGVTISKPENDKFSAANRSRLPMKSKIYKPINKLKEPSKPEPVLSNVQEDIRELKSSSSFKIKSNHDQSVLTESAEISTAIDDKEVVLVSNINKNLQIERTSSSTIESYRKKSQDLGKPLPKSQFHNDNTLSVNTDNVNSELGVYNVDPSPNIRNNDGENDDVVIKSYNSTNETRQSNFNLTTNVSSKSANAFKVPENIHLHDLSSPKISVLTKNIFDDPIHMPQENLKNQIKYPTTMSKENLKSLVTNPSKDFNDLTDITPLPQYGINHKLAGYPNANNVRDNVLTNEPIGKQRTSILVYTSVSGQLSNERHADHKDGNDIYLNNEVNTNKSDIIKPRESKGGNDRYVAVLNKGDTVNLKLNIQIQNDDNSNKQSNNINTATREFVKEKASQINIVSHSILQNKSLVSLIVKEIEKRHKKDRGVIIVQCKGCPHCMEHKESLEPRPLSKCDLLPHSTFIENAEKGCICCDKDPKAPIGYVYPTNAIISCSSQKQHAQVSLIKSPAGIVSHVVTPHQSFNEPVFEKVTEKGCITTKKSVAISDNSHVSISHLNVLAERSIISNKECCKMMSGINKDGDSQTDWCNVLLEVKREDDGHYTFRLPALETLKQYKLV